MRATGEDEAALEGLVCTRSAPRVPPTLLVPPPSPPPPAPPPLSLKAQLKLKQLETDVVSAMREKRKEGVLGKYRDRLLVGARVEKQVAQQEAHKHEVESWEQTEKERQRKRLKARLKRKQSLKRSKTTGKLGAVSVAGNRPIRHE